MGVLGHWGANCNTFPHLPTPQAQHPGGGGQGGAVALLPHRRLRLQRRRLEPPECTDGWRGCSYTAVDLACHANGHADAWQCTSHLRGNACSLLCFACRARGSCAPVPDLVLHPPVPAHEPGGPQLWKLCRLASAMLPQGKLVVPAAGMLCLVSVQPTACSCLHGWRVARRWAAWD